MISFVAKRLVWAVLTIGIVSVLTFAGTEMLPGDTASKILGRNATPDALESLRQRLETDKPAVERYWTWVSGLATGDWGHSLTVGNFMSGNQGVAVAELVQDRLANTLYLLALTSVVLFPLGILLGVIAAANLSGPIDGLISNVTLVFLSLPEYVSALLLILVFAVLWPVLPAISMVSSDAGMGERIQAMVLPAATLVLGAVGQVARMTRGSVIDILEADYVRMARLKGLPERRVLFDHVLRNALAPTLQIIALNVSYLVGGAVVVEAVFSYPGVGDGLVKAVAARDLPVVQVLALAAAATYLIANLAADTFNVLLTPRLRTRL